MANLRQKKRGWLLSLPCVCFSGTFILRPFKRANCLKKEFIMEVKKMPILIEALFWLIGKLISYLMKFSQYQILPFEKL